MINIKNTFNNFINYFSSNIFKNKMSIFAIIFVVFLIKLMFLPYNHFSGIDEEEDKNLFDRIFNRLYLITTTLSSVGYGDIYPKTKMARGIIMILQMFVILHIANV